MTGVPHAHGRVVHELHQVLVGGGDHHLEPLRRRAPRQGRDDVVGLHVGLADHHEPEVRRASCVSGTCRRRSSGIGGRWAL